MSTHPAVVTVGVYQPLEVRQLPTITPSKNEVRVRVEWTASTPLDLHQADGGLLVQPPQVLGDSVAGTVIEVGPTCKNLEKGDKVFGFTWRKQAEKAHQLYITVPEYLLGKMPAGFTMQQAVVVCNNFVTAWHTLTKDFGFELPWPKREGYTPNNSHDGILIWGGSSSSGMYTAQILKWYGYTNIIATASKTHHDKLRSYGVTRCFDYREANVEKHIQEFLEQKPGKGLRFVLDCIASQKGSLQPISKVAQKGAKVAALLPVIIKDATESTRPEYSMDVENSAKWAEGVEVVGVRTHFYMDNEFLAKNLQPVIMPEALAKGIIVPNDQVIVEGKTLLERAERALSMLRRKEISGGRLVWRVADE